MSEKKSPKPHNDERPAKKSWVPPRIKTGKLYEVNAYACAKLFACGRTGFKLS